MYADASHNMLFSLNGAQWASDLAKSSKGDVTGYQEAGGREARQALARHCSQNNRGLFHPKSCGVPISWNRNTFSQLIEGPKPVQGRRQVHLSANAMGINAPFKPDREITWVGLAHKKSRKKVLRINVHTIAGATDPTPEERPQLAQWSDWAIGQYWLDVMSFTAAQASRQEPGKETVKSYWDAITIGGDYNAMLSNKKRWYYPGSMLPALYLPDRVSEGLDHLQFTHGSDLKRVRRWKVQGFTDHAIHFASYEFAAREDFPG